MNFLPIESFQNIFYCDHGPEKVVKRHEENNDISRQNKENFLCKENESSQIL